MSYTITPGPSGADYIITFSDGRVLVIDAMGFPGMSRLDGAADGVIDIYGLLANADASTNLTAEFMSASGAAFTVTAGGREDDYLITFADGRVLVVDAQNLSQLDSLDGVTDTVIDVDGLIANSDPSNADCRVYKRLRSRFHRSAWPSRHVLYHHLCRWPHFVG